MAVVYREKLRIMNGRGGAAVAGGDRVILLHGRTKGGYILERCGSEKSSRDSSTFPPRKDDVPIRVAAIWSFFKAEPRKGVKGPLVPCGVSLVTFPLLSQKYEPTAMDFWLTERTHASAASRASLVKESHSSKTGQGGGIAGGSVSASGVLSLSLPPSFALQMPPPSSEGGLGAHSCAFRPLVLYCPQRHRKGAQL